MAIIRRRGRPFMCPVEIFDVEDLGCFEKLLYIFLCRLANQDFKLENKDGNFTSYYIASKIGTSEKNVEKAFNKLLKKGYIESKRVNEFGVIKNYFYINDPADVKNKHVEHVKGADRIVKRPTRKLKNPLNPNRIG